MPSRLLAAACLAATAALPASAAADIPEGFQGRALLALADGAMLASGYIDGRLGPREPDLLRVIPLDGTGPTDLPVSNSVATWPNVLALSPDQRYAIITEPFAQPAPEAQVFSEIERGQQITVVDLADPSAPRIVQSIEAPSSPAAVDVHPDGRVVAVTLPFIGQIALYPFTDGQLGEPAIQDLGLDDLNGSFVPEIKWRPDGRFAAVTLGGAGRTVFYRFTDGRLEPWGEPMHTAPLPGKGVWTADGRHFIVTTITATGDMAQVGYGQNASLFAVFAFDETDTPDSPPRRANDRSTEYASAPIQHARVAHVPGGLGYVENFVQSPDGRFVVGLNMVASWLPIGHPGRSTHSELTLFRFDGETGGLSALQTVRLDDTILPQGIAFDAAGDRLMVTSFQHDDRPGGSISFWRLREAADGTAELVADGQPIAAPRGVHFLATVR